MSSDWNRYTTNFTYGNSKVKWVSPDHFDRRHIELAKMLSASPAMQFPNPLPR
jgi:hypothetical protein